MAYCNQTLKGITLDCSHSLGGIKTVYIANYNDVTDIKYNASTGTTTGTTSTGVTGSTTGVTYTGDTITGITMASGTYFKPYQFRKQTGSMTSTLTVDETAGVNYVSTELSLVFTKMETAKRIELSALSVGQLAVIVEDSNGTFWYLGKDDYVSVSAGGGQTGTAKGDGNNYTLTLRDESDTYPYEITKEAVESVVEKTQDKK